MVMRILLVFLLYVGLAASGGGRGDSTDSEADCEIDIDGHCFWTFVHGRRNVNYARAERICGDRGSKPAIIPNSETYKNILKQVRSKIPGYQSWTSVWTGMKYDPQTREQTPNEGYWHWFHIPSRTRKSRIPWAGDYFVRPYTHVYLEVKKFARSRYQGLINREPAANKRGVVCEKLD